MGNVAIADDERGLVIVTFEGEVDDVAFSGYLDALSRNLTKQRPYSVVIDARKAQRPTALQRKRQAEWIGRHQLQLARFCAGTVFVIESPMIRGALTAILWLQPPPQAHTIVATLEEGVRWARAQLEAMTAATGTPKG